VSQSKKEVLFGLVIVAYLAWMLLLASYGPGEAMLAFLACAVPLTILWARQR
jgi:hypothetical protein